MLRLDLLLAACLLPLAAQAQAPLIPQFTPIDIPAHDYNGGWEHFVGGGVAAFDCNGDALPDLYAAGGANPAKLLINTTDQDSHRLSFVDQTPSALALTDVIGAYPLDLDSDAVLDLVILRVGPDLMLRGTGECDFAPFSEFSFHSDDHWSTAFSATWEAGNTLPTLAFGTYVDRKEPKGPFEACDDTLLYRPHDAGYDAPLPLAPGYCALSALFSDWNRSGRADLRLSNDRHYYVRGGQEQLWAMEPQPRLFTENEGWRSYALWGMGIASRDVDGDGFQDVYLTSMGDQKFQLRAPEATGPVWRDVTYDFGTTAHRPYVGGDGRPSTGWHAAFGDVNNDGRDDIFVAKGNVEQMPDAAQADPNNLMLQDSEGRFAEVGAQAGIASLHRGRGAALVDLNLDGLLDLAVVNRRAEMEVWQNTTKDAGNWLLLQLHMPGPNALAVGAFVEVISNGKTLLREITIGGGHASGDAGYMHFGLGSADRADVRVIWPGGKTGPWREIDVNQRLTLLPQVE